MAGMTQDELIEAVVRFVVTYDESYTLKEISDPPLTEDHVFGEYVMHKREPQKLLARSDAHREQRVRAIAASAAKHLSKSDGYVWLQKLIAANKPAQTD